MNTILSLIKTITFCMPFVFLCIACYKINLPKAHRYKQYPLPVFAIAYCLIAIFGLEFIQAYIFIKLENLFEQSKYLMDIISIILPEEAFAKIMADMKKFIEGLMIYAMNTVFVCFVTSFFGNVPCELLDRIDFHPAGIGVSGLVG